METSNDKTKAAAEFAIRSIDASRDTLYLAGRGRLFHQQYGHFPRSIGDLLSAGLIHAAPTEPFGSHYVMQPATGEVRSWYLLARELKRDIHVLKKIVDRYRVERNSYPPDLAELHREGYLAEIPGPFGVTYSIRQDSGDVDAVLPSNRVYRKGS